MLCNADLKVRKFEGLGGLSFHTHFRFTELRANSFVSMSSYGGHFALRPNYIEDINCATLMPLKHRSHFSTPKFEPEPDQGL